MKRTMFIKVNIIGGLSLLSSGFLQAFIPAIPATEGSRQILVNRIAPQENALETKIDIIDTNVDDIETSVGVGLSTKVDRINNNMKIPITAGGVISTRGSYILANNVGSITIDGGGGSAFGIQLDLNEYIISGSLTIQNASRCDIYNGSIYSIDVGGPAIGYGGTGASLVTIEDITIRGVTAFDSNGLPCSTMAFRDCWFRGSDSAVGMDFSDGSDVLIENCRISNFKTGILLSNMSRCVVQHCSIDDCTGTAIDLVGTGSDNRIRDNMMSNNARGIAIAASQNNNFIFQNVITGCSDSTGARAINDLGSGNRVYGNVTFNNNGIETTNYSLTVSLQAGSASIATTTGVYANISLP